MNHAFILTLALIFTGRASASPEHDAYTQLFPLHAEFCSLSQIKPVGAKEGGPGGHATLYIEGLCKDYSVNYPKVVPCAVAKNSKEFAHTGAGISVDNDYRNINWSVVPGYDLFTHGLTPTAPGKVDEAAKKAVVAAATAKRVYEGVVFNDELVGKDSSIADYQQKIAGFTIGTDIAVQFGRDMECVRFPVPAAKLQAMADYLNSRNAPYVSGEKIYEWSLLSNNCAMLAADVLAVGLVRPEIPMDEKWYQQIFDLGIPRNGLTELQDIVHYGGLTWLQEKLDTKEYAGMNFSAIRKDPLRWKSLVELGTVPTGFGGISQVFPIYSDNSLYLPDLHNKYLPSPEGLYALSTRAFTRPEFTDLKASATYWLAVYKRALKLSTKFKRSADRDLYEAFIMREINRVRAAKLPK